MGLFLFRVHELRTFMGTYMIPKVKNEETMRLVQLTIKSLTYLESGSQPLQVATHVLRVYRPFIYSSLHNIRCNFRDKKKRVCQNDKLSSLET